MPLPGGPSDKLGNRYELRWVVRKMLDLVTGRIAWLRVEPPGEDAIEFRYKDASSECVYQVKRGVSGGGHWTIAALNGVLHDFGELLETAPDVRCFFCSEHAAPELKELSERARSAASLSEFSVEFLKPKWLDKAWRAVSEIWGTSEQETFRRLRQITAATAGEDHLRQDTNVILDLMFDAQAEVCHAVLAEFALDSLHERLTASSVVSRLAHRGIHKSASRGPQSLVAAMLPPPATGIRRDHELHHISDLLDKGQATILLGGITGIGKTTVAAQFASEASGPVCWVDCGLIASAPEALSALSEYMAKTTGDKSIASALANKNAQLASVGRLLGQRLAAADVTLIWDGIDQSPTNDLLPVIDAISTTIAGSAQLVTAQTYPDKTSTRFGFVAVGRLSKAVIRDLLVDAYPAARVPELEAAEEATQGHPYLVQLLVGAANNVDLGTAIDGISSQSDFDSFVSVVLKLVSPDARHILNTLAWLRLPFSPAYVTNLGGTKDTLRELSSRYLVLRAVADRYRVHEIVGSLLTKSMSDEERLEAHERLALVVQSLEGPSWQEVQAMLYHANEAAMEELVRQAGSALLDYASSRGHWSLVREAAERLVEVPLSADHPYPHFMLGKCCRMTGDLERALHHYEQAENKADDVAMKGKSRYERASVLWDMGNREDAESIYEELSDSDDTGTSVEAKIALAMGRAADGDVPGAIDLLDEAGKTAEAAGLTRELAEVQQATGSTLADAERWEEAREHLRAAYKTRFSLNGPEAYDVYGWFHLYGSLLQVERALKNADGASSAAHGLYRFAVVAGSLSWEVNAAHAMCVADPDFSDQEVATATTRLRRLADDRSSEVEDRIHALIGLIRCEWTLQRYELAIIALLELLALSHEHQVPVPVFAHLPSDGSATETVAQVPGGWVLLIPEGQGMDFLVDLVNGVLQQRPELAQYATGFIAAPKESQNAADPDAESD